MTDLMRQINSNYEVLIIGGGPAGLGAAMALGRMHREVLVCDDNRPRNAPAEHMNNFPSHDGTSPAKWRQEARDDLAKYQTIHFYKGSVLEVEKDGSCFRAKLLTGEAASFKKVVLAYGVVDQLPSTPGFQELWGKAVFHCPYCHGFEIRGSRLGLVGNGKVAEHLLPITFSLSKDFILFTNGKPDLSEDLRAHLRERKVRIVEDKIGSLHHEKDRLKAVVLENGETIEREKLFLAPKLPFQSKSTVGEQLGCEKNEMGLYKIDLMGKTTTEGVFAAGDIMTGMHSVVTAVASGQAAGAGAASELLSENFRRM